MAPYEQQTPHGRAVPPVVNSLPGDLLNFPACQKVFPQKYETDGEAKEGPLCFAVRRRPLYYWASYREELQNGRERLGCL